MKVSERESTSHWDDVIRFYDELFHIHQWDVVAPLRDLVNDLSKHDRYSRLLASHSHANLILSIAPYWPERLEGAHLVVIPKSGDYAYELQDVLSGKLRRLESGTVHPSQLLNRLNHSLDYLVKSMVRAIEGN